MFDEVARHEQYKEVKILVLFFVSEGSMTRGILCIKVCPAEALTVTGPLQGTLNNQSFAPLLPYRKKISSEASARLRYNSIPAVNFFLCLEYERNTRLFRIPFIQGSVLLACCPSQGYGLFSFIDIVNT